MRLEEIGIVPFEGAEDVAQYVAFVASVGFGSSSTPEATFRIQRRRPARALVGVRELMYTAEPSPQGRGEEFSLTGYPSLTADPLLLRRI